MGQGTEMNGNVRVARIKCPQCGKVTAWKDNPDRPFCSERCRIRDLGNWADESYRVAGDPVPLEQDDQTD